MSLAKVICFASAKGGTGKTVISASFAEFLGVLGKKVLLIDTDASTNGLTLLYLKKIMVSKKALTVNKGIQRGMFESNNGQIPDSVMVQDNVDLIPASFIMEQTENCDKIRYRLTLESTLAARKSEYDYIFLDAQAGSDVYAEISIALADEVVIVSEYDPVSFAGVERLKTLFSKIMPYEKRWVLYNKVLPAFAKELGKYRTIERYLPPIPWDEEVVIAFNDRKLALDTDKGSEHTLALMRTISVLFGDGLKKEIANWKQAKNELIREPIIAQEAATEDEIDAFQRTIVETEYKIRRLKSRPRAIAFYAFSFLAMILFYLGVLLFQVYPMETLVAVSILTITTIFSVILIITYIRKDEEKSRTKELKLSVQRKNIQFKLDELIETNKRQRALLESDLDKLLERLSNDSVKR